MKSLELITMIEDIFWRDKTVKKKGNLELLRLFTESNRECAEPKGRALRIFIE
jgi:hypothetical protein